MAASDVVVRKGRWRSGWGAKKNQNNRDFGLRLMIDLAVDYADNIKAAAAGSCRGNRLCAYIYRYRYS